MATSERLLLGHEFTSNRWLPESCSRRAPKSTGQYYCCEPRASHYVAEPDAIEATASTATAPVIDFDTANPDFKRAEPAAPSPVESEQEKLMFSTTLLSLQIYWDSTSLSAFLNCPRKYQYQILEGWVPQQTALDLEFGIRYHSALEAADRLRIAGADLHTQINVAASAALSEPEFPLPTAQKNRFNLVRSVIWYLLNYANRFPKHLGPNSVEVPFRFPTEIAYGAERLILCGHMDGVVEMPDGIYALERKTTGKTLNEQYFDSFTPNPQITIYTLASHIVIHAPAKGVLLDACQSVVNFSAFDRRTIQRTPGQLEEFMNDLGQWFRSAVQYAESNHWPMNEASCRICQFNRVCSKDPAVRDSFLHTDFLKRHWNPLIERTKDDGRNTADPQGAKELERATDYLNPGEDGPG